jgi:hypothetical protein
MEYQASRPPRPASGNPACQGDGDHPRGEVDAEDTQTSGGEVGADTAGAAAGVGNGTELPAGAPLDEAVDHRDVQARLRVQFRQETGIVRGNDVVAFAASARGGLERSRTGTVQAASP